MFFAPCPIPELANQRAEHGELDPLVTDRVGIPDSSIPKRVERARDFIYSNLNFFLTSSPLNPLASLRILGDAGFEQTRIAI